MLLITTSTDVLGVWSLDEHLDPLELALQTVLRFPTWALGTKHGSSALNC